jgi:hypothetical protein
MAKKRRRPHNRAQGSPRGTVRTAERPSPDGRTEDGAGSGARPEGAGTRAPARSRPSGPQRTRAEKKELARRQRDEARRQMRRAERLRMLVWLSGTTAVLAIVGVLIFRPDQPPPTPNQLPGELTTEAPWPANADQSAARADAIGLPAEGTTMHTHADVQVFVHGEQETVPQSIGIFDNAARSIHTHTPDGVVHMESSVERDFTLGEFFDVWGVRLTARCLGGYCVQGGDQLQVFKDGQEVSGSIRDVVLDDRSVVVVTFGTADELPDPIPSTFDFGSITP